MKSEDSALRRGSQVARGTTIAVAVLLLLASAYAGTITTVSSTVPSNGDLNPYGVAVVPVTTGALTEGNILVSNFNNSQNLQGTGTTIVQISPSGDFSLFAQIDPNKLPGRCPGGVGLTTALVALKSGWVIVGSLPTKDGTAATAKAGCLLVVDNNGHVAETFTDKEINGPWDMTAADFGDEAALFVTNVLNGTVKAKGKVVHRGTVLRLDVQIPDHGMPKIKSITKIGSGFAERTDPAALVIGPTGVGLSRQENSSDDHNSVIYIADSLNNRITAIDDPLQRHDSGGTGRTITQGKALNDPLGLTVARNDILSVNGANGFLVRTRNGQQVSKVLLDNIGHPRGAGSLFGLAVVPGQGIYFVDDNANALNLFH